MTGLLLVVALAAPAAAQGRQVAGVVVQMQGPADQPELKPIVMVTDASGTRVDVPLHDDAEPPDDEAGDGVWSGIAMGLSGDTFTVSMPSGADTFATGTFTVADPWRPIVRFRPAPGGSLVSFEPTTGGAGGTHGANRRADPWQASTRRAPERPSRWWLAAAGSVLLGLGALLGRPRRER